MGAHLAAEGVHPTMFCSHWFITLFAYTLPFDHLLRVWDVLFLEGPKIIFRRALGNPKTPWCSTKDPPPMHATAVTHRHECHVLCSAKDPSHACRRLFFSWHERCVWPSQRSATPASRAAQCPLTPADRCNVAFKVVADPCCRVHGLR